MIKIDVFFDKIDDVSHIDSFDMFWHAHVIIMNINSNNTTICKAVTVTQRESLQGRLITFIHSNAL